MKHRLVRWMAKQSFVDSLHVVLQEQLSQLDITHVLDIGANRGQYGRLLRRLGFRGRIISFEPVHACFESLSEVAKADGNWEVHRIALGDTDGSAVINVMSDDVFSSLLPPSELGRAMFPSDNRVMQTETVPVRRLGPLLSSVVPPNEFGRTHFKSDAQGSEPAILSGLGELVNELPSLQMEVSLVGIYENQAGYQEVLQPLHDLGFELTAFFPVARDSSLRIVEADVLLRHTPQ